MKIYPSITNKINPYAKVYCFDKLDGNNIFGEWNNKRGFYKFGSRNILIDENSKPLGKSISIIRNKYEDDLSKIFVKNKWDNVICFFEYHGPNSFAGRHLDTEEQTVTLFDVNPCKDGILYPLDFINHFGYLDIPSVLFIGRINEDLVDQVKLSSLKGMTFEGCVCKGNIDKKTKMPIMFKIKSKAWLDKLKEYCKNDQGLFDKLS